MEYLVKLTPLEPYFFGKEEVFQIPTDGKSHKSTYYISSAEIPEQTTVLGTLRYTILERAGLLNTDFSYDAARQNELVKYIGSSSFDFGAEEEQDFGKIKKIYPLFLLNEKGEELVKNPFNNKCEEKGYISIQMSDVSFNTSCGKISLPVKEEYVAKDGYGSGWFNLQDKKIEKCLFESVVMVGNRKNGGENKDNSFFKREAKRLEKGYSFAFFADVEEGCLPNSTICYMGQRKSAFRLEAIPCENGYVALCEKIKAAFSEGEKWQYSMSNLIADTTDYETFAIVSQCQVRGLKTEYSGDRYIRRIKRGDKQFNVILRGSVFHKNCSVLGQKTNLQKIGYNHIIEIGGN